MVCGEWENRPDTDHLDTAVHRCLRESEQTRLGASCGWAQGTLPVSSAEIDAATLGNNRSKGGAGRSSRREQHQDQRTCGAIGRRMLAIAIEIWDVWTPSRSQTRLIRQGQAS